MCTNFKQRQSCQTLQWTFTSFNIQAMDEKTVLNIQSKTAEADIDAFYNEHNVLFNLKEVNISGGLNDVPNVIFQLKYLTTLNLSNNSLERLPKEVGHLCNLHTLNLSSNSLNLLPKTLKEIPHLSYLDLSKNKFSEVPDVLYYGVRALRVLDLSYNVIHNFNDPPGCLNKLLTLKISHNFLKQLPFWIFDSVCQLQCLYANGNPLHLGDGLHCCSRGGFESLQILNIENCSLTYEKIQILCLFKNINMLHLGNKKYEEENEIPKNYMGTLKMDIFKNYLKMKYLSLQNVHIATLPPNFDFFKNIEILDLSDNLLSWLPESFCSLVNLKILNFTSNQLLFLPNNIGNIVNLQQIHLGHNKLCEVPESFYNLKNLEFIDLYNNNLEKFNPDIFYKEKLKGLDLGMNNLNLEFSESGGNVSNFWKSYNYFKDKFRKHFSITDGRCDVQKAKLEVSCEEKTCDSETNSCRRSVSSFDSESLSDNEDSPSKITEKSSFEEENWEVADSNESEGDELFDPNELKNLEQRSNIWCEQFQSNYCPAKFHMKSILKTYIRNCRLASENKVVEDGQFDSD